MNGDTLKEDENKAYRRYGPQTTCRARRLRLLQNRRFP
jgi:hypothetical protein